VLCFDDGAVAGDVQRQRIGIARVLLRDPDILLLAENGTYADLWSVQAGELETIPGM